MANNINYGPELIKSKVYDITLLSVSWVGTSSPYTYTINSITGISSSNIVHILPSYNITGTENTALTNAVIVDGGINSNIITLRALGTKPAVNIPIRLIISDSVFVESIYELDGLPEASTSELGTIKLASNSEVSLGVNNSKAVTPLGLANNYLKLSGGTLTGTLTGTTINATNFNGTLTGTATKLSTTSANWSTNGTIDNVVGQLCWKKYGNGYTIFDASAGTTPSGALCNNTTPTTLWSAQSPTIMGWNGTSTVGVRTYISNTSDAIAGVSCYTGTTNPSATTRVNINGYVYVTKLYNAVYNDYAECFRSNTCSYLDKNKIVEIDDNGYIQLASENSTRVIGIISDNYAFLIGGTEDEVKQCDKVPVGLIGTLMVYASDIVSIDNVGKFICSDNYGLAKISENNENGTIVGKVIGINKELNQYKVLLVLK